MGNLSQVIGDGFVPAQHEAAQDFEAVPPGKYLVLISAADLKTTKSGTGQYIKLECVILDGAHKNRKLWANINVANPNPVAVDIGMKELAALGQAVGLQGPLTDTSQVLNQQVVAVVKVKDGQNEIRTFKHIREYQAPPAPASPAPASPAPAPPAPAPPAPAPPAPASPAPASPAPAPPAPASPAPASPAPAPPAPASPAPQQQSQTVSQPATPKPPWMR